MIKVVKLQHFGTSSNNGKGSSLYCDDAASLVPATTKNKLTLSNYNTNNNIIKINEPKYLSIELQQAEQNNNRSFIKQNNQLDRQSSNTDFKKNFNDGATISSTNNTIDSRSNKPTLNRSKSATEFSLLKQNDTNNNSTNSINNNSNNNGNNNNSNGKSISEISQSIAKRSILKKHTLKQRKILEWAKKKSSLTLTDEQPIQNQSNTPNNISASSSRHNQNNNKKQEQIEDDDDDFTTFIGAAAAAVIQKSDIERNLRQKLFETELIDLSKARFKTLEMMEYQKKLFIERQLKKAKSLPGLLRYILFLKLKFSSIS